MSKKRFRPRLNPLQIKALGLTPRKNPKNNKYSISREDYDRVAHLKNTTVSTTTDTETQGYLENKVLSAIGKDGTIMNIDDYCEHHKLPRNDIHSYKLITHTGEPWYNIAFKEQVVSKEEFSTDFIEEIVKKYLKPVKQKKLKNRGDANQFTRVVYTDVHIGMCTDKEGSAMYATPWNKDTLLERLDILVESILNHRKGGILVIDELGDYLDGWDGYTARGGHKLPQNMTNREVFDLGVLFKVSLVDRLYQHFDKIILNNITRDNHSADFGYVVNSAVKMILNERYEEEEVSVVNYGQFINHYQVGKHVFVITHGKDDKHMKFGFKPQLDTKALEKIDQYLKHNRIYSKGEFIEFSKGDSHQMLFDYTTSMDFDYFNFPAFSPASEWVQTNFKKGKSGFVIFNIDYESNTKITIPIFF